MDLLFFMLIGWGDIMDEKLRYYFVGFTMIATVLLLLAGNIGFGLYYTISELAKKCKKKKII